MLLIYGLWVSFLCFSLMVMLPGSYVAWSNAFGVFSLNFAYLSSHRHCLHYKPCETVYTPALKQLVTRANKIAIVSHGNTLH